LQSQPEPFLVDGGAHTGEFADLADHVPALRVLAFEPQLDLAQALCNGNSRVQVIGAALGDKTGLATLLIPPDARDSGRATLLPEFATEEWRRQSTLIVPLDALGLMQTVTAIKLNIEGMEWQALWGASHTIRGDNPALIIEYHAGRADTLEVLGLLEIWGYRWDIIENADIWCEYGS
jgi:FkbM family methyltransferase